MIIVFDLDNTLYDELTYVRSGFWAVSRHLAHQFGLAEAEVFDYLTSIHTYGRGQLFNDALQHFGIFNPTRVRECIRVYRTHHPSIRLNPDAEACLKRLGRKPFYIVTDGNKTVQYNKLQSLGLTKKARFCYLTYRYGIRHSKPSPYCFLKICERDNVSPQQVVYIADNPHKDFVGIKPLGFKTIRILQGPFKDTRLSPDYEAHREITSLDELDFTALFEED